MKANASLLQALLSVAGLEYRPRELVHLNDGAGRLIGSSDTTFTRRIRRELCRINEVFSSVRIALVCPDVRWLPIAVHIDDDVLHTPHVEGAKSHPTGACYRIFSGGWNLGGRLYGPFWQNSSACPRVLWRSQSTTV